MVPALDYPAYEALAEPDRVSWFDQLQWKDIAHPERQRSIKGFFTQVYENEPSSYLRQKSVEWFGDLALGSVLRSSAAREFLLDIDDKEPLIQTVRLRYLFLLFGDDEDVQHALATALHDEDDDVASEANYRTGLIHLLYRANQGTENQFAAELTRAKQYFRTAVTIRENRIDAEFFELVVDYLNALLASQNVILDDTMRQLNAILWQRQLWGRRPLDESFEWHIYQGLLNIRVTAEHTAAKGWGDLRKEFNVLAKYFNDLVAVTSVSRRLQHTYSQFAEGIGQWIVNQYYVKNLSACRTNIEFLLAEEPTDSSLHDFLLRLQNALDTAQQKKSIDLDFDLVIELQKRAPELDIKKLNASYQNLMFSGKTSEEAVTTILLECIDKVKSQGYGVSNELFSALKEEIRLLISDYPEHKWQSFLRPLADIVRYTYHTARFPRELFPHLAREAPTSEKVYHLDFFKHLSNGPNAGKYHWETPDKVAGSRIDITYEENDLLFPIEVKRDTEEVTWERIKANYLAQAIAYTRVHDQLGFLVVFDVSNQNRRSDIRNYFNVMHLEYTSGPTEKYKDYILAVIIPANNLSPSLLTHYSK